MNVASFWSSIRQAIFRASITASLLGILAACQLHTAKESKTEAYPLREVSDHLKEQYAMFRARQISDVSYDLNIELSNTKTSFHAVNQINFNFAPLQNSPLTIDLNGGEIESITANGEDIEWQYNNYFISIDSKILNTGKNTLVISYNRPYSTSGDGLHRYQDEQSGNVYLYTNFEPYNANRLFPHFDQPDIKATYTLKVSAPKHWQVISSTRESKKIEHQDRTLWDFPKSALMSSYIFPLHAGPYKVWEDEYHGESSSIPLRLFARQELAEHVVEEDWFKFTKESFEFFNEYFELPYPYVKYDQIIVPEFNAGAMENLAAVTFTERFVKRGKKLKHERMRLANVIAHEMAHMWFGNLVTMRWWNGLWLNESFATYMANLQLEKASEFENTWNTFYTRTKQWAYNEDQRPTTHPIELPVPTTSDAFSNFDGITYGKGASVLKQLPHFVGPENFRKGIALYLRTHANGNTELQDFTGALEKTSQQNLKQWTKEWLNEEGLNTIQATPECKNNNLASVTIAQTAPPKHPTLRTQKTQIALIGINRKNNSSEIIDLIATRYSGASTTLKPSKPTPCPDLIFPNFDDWAYVKVNLDSKSQSVLLNHISAIDDEGLRTMLWQAQWDSVRDIQLRLDDYIQFVIKQLPSESNATIVRQVSDQLVNAFQYLNAIDPTKERYASLREQINATFETLIEQVPAGSDQQLMFFDAWVNSAHTPENFAKIRALLDGETLFKGIEPDQDRRWNMVKALNRYLAKGYEKYRKYERDRDLSDRGTVQYLVAHATRPLAENKAQWLEHIRDKAEPYKYATFREVMLELFPSNQNKLLEAFADEIFSMAESLSEWRDDRFMRSFSLHTLPDACTQSTSKGFEARLDTFANLSPTVNKMALFLLQENQRCVDIGALMAKAPVTKAPLTRSPTP